MEEAEVHRPVGALADNCEAWTQSLRRRAANRVNAAGKETLSRAHSTWKQLKEFASVTKLELSDMGGVALEKFLYSSTAGS